MDKKNLIFAVIIGLIFICLAYSYGRVTGEQKAAESQSPLEGKIQAYSNLAGLIESNLVQESFYASGEIIESSGNTLTLVRNTGEEGERSNPFKISASKDAEISSVYVLPEGSSSKIVRSVTNAEGKKVNLGEENIVFEDIKMGDSADIAIQLRLDGSLEGTCINIFPKSVKESL